MASSLTPPPPATNTNTNSSSSSSAKPLTISTSPCPVKPEIPTTPSSSSPSAPLLRPLPSNSSDADVVLIPSYSKWFSWKSISQCEMRFLPEFFDSSSPSRNPTTYMYYRNSIIKRFRLNASSKITFTDARKTLAGDVLSVRRVFDFLETWGLINYSPPPASVLSKTTSKWEDKDPSLNNKPPSSTTSSSVDATPPPPTPTPGILHLNSTTSPSPTPNSKGKDSSKRLCSGCKSVCTIACFACDKYDLTLCARCYVRGNYRVGVNSSDFRRVEISEDARTDWTDKETLQLLEAIMHYGDDWKKVAHHVGGRTEKDCITHFIKLPFGEEYAGYTDGGEVDDKYSQMKDQNDIERGSDSKRMRLTPLADASNPIMAQAAFLSALAGVEIAEAAAQAAVKSLTEVEYGASRRIVGSFTRNVRHQDADTGVTSNGDTTLGAEERACLEANSQLEKEELDMGRALSRITEVEMKEIQDKIVRFEELDLQMEKEWQQLEQMRNLLFTEQLNLLFRSSSSGKTSERLEENVRTD